MRTPPNPPPPSSINPAPIPPPAKKHPGRKPFPRLPKYDAPITSERARALLARVSDPGLLLERGGFLRVHGAQFVLGRALETGRLQTTEPTAAWINALLPEPEQPRWHGFSDVVPSDELDAALRVVAHVHGAIEAQTELEIARKGGGFLALDEPAARFLQRVCADSAARSAGPLAEVLGRLADRLRDGLAAQ